MVAPFIHLKIQKCRKDLLKWRRTLQQQESSGESHLVQELEIIQNLGVGDSMAQFHQCQHAFQKKLEEEELI